MAVHSRILTWEISWTEKPGRLCPWGHKRIGYDLVTKEDHAKNIFKSKRYFLTSSAALKIETVLARQPHEMEMSQEEDRARRMNQGFVYFWPNLILFIFNKL